MRESVFFRLKLRIWRDAVTPLLVLYLIKFRGVIFNGKVSFEGCPVFMGRDGSVSFEDNCYLVSDRLRNPIGLFRPCIFETMSDRKGGVGQILIGKNFKASGVCVVAMSRVTIGNNVQIGANVTIVDNDFHELSGLERREGKGEIRCRPIVIEDDVWIAMSVVVLKGVTIGRGSIIGAGVVLRENVPPFSVVTGVPPIIKYSERAAESLATIPRGN